MTRSQIFKAAHKIAKTLIGNYTARLSYALKRVYYLLSSNQEVIALEKITIEGQTQEVYLLEIPFKSRTLRKRAKQMGAKWLADIKCWSVTCCECELDWAELSQCLVQNQRITSMYADENYGAQVLAGTYYED
jgi:hypothetical protein